MNELEIIISERIRKEGAISFCDFMEMALYYPGLGYYTSGRRKIGREGDYFTSCTLSPEFGQLIAVQLQEMWQLLGTREFTIVEYGAGTGHLCRSVIDYFRQDNELYENLQYRIIEKSPVMRGFEKEIVDKKVTWHESIDELKGLTGCVLANEVADNFAVHRVRMEDQLMEVFVNYDGRFCEELRPASPQLTAYFGQLRVQLPRGYETEVNLQAEDWLRTISENLHSGYFMTIDYGYASGDLYGPSRRNGTLTCYHQHSVSESFYRNIGHNDITAHVNFSALGLYGQKYGLGFAGFREQGSFLQALGFFDLLKKNRDPGEDPVARTKKENLLVHTLLGEMGKKFKVLALKKNAPEQQLRGFLPISAGQESS